MQVALSGATAAAVGVVRVVLGPTPRGRSRRVVDVEDAVVRVDARLPVGWEWHFDARMLHGRRRGRDGSIR
jgi:hypothetical protein